MTKEVLIITNEKDVTSDFVVTKLRERQASFYRFNTDQLGKSVKVNFDFEAEEYSIYDDISGENIDLSKIKSVYFRRPEVDVNNDGLTEGEVNFLRTELYYTLEGLYRILDHAFWINNVYFIRKAENKIYQQILARKTGLIMPKSIITNDTQAALNFYSENYGNCIIKPLRSGMVSTASSDEAIIFTSRVRLSAENVERIKMCPVYLQNHIAKKADVRVTIVGKKIFGALIHSQQNEISKTDWRKAVLPLPYSRFELPDEIAAKCLCLIEELSLNFGAIDFILGARDELIFLEVNPNGQWAWIEKKLNYKISDEITALLLKGQIE
jgi:glutathione synthase/RimK-type ligase-like ATP-grasp enzyme